MGTDGLHSRVRKWAGIQPIWSSAKRLGIRQHFRIEPWTDFVEVYWHKSGQANVTPVAEDQVCIAMIGTEKGIRTSDLPGLFPLLAKRIGRAQPVGPPAGAATMSATMSGVFRGSISLLGDASGSVDAVTGEGIHVAVRQAIALAEALAAGDLEQYQIAHRRIMGKPKAMAKVLLLLDGRDRLRHMAFRGLSAFPKVFSGLLAFHVGRKHLFYKDQALRGATPKTITPARLGKSR